MNTLSRDEEGVTGQDLFDMLVEAYEEHPVVLSMPGQPERNISDFDYPYTVVVVNFRHSEASLLLTDDKYSNAPEYLRVSVTDSGENLEMYALEAEYGGTYIGDVFSVREY